MRGLAFDEVFALLAALQFSPRDLARLREWLAGIAHPAECIALIERAAAGRPRTGCALRPGLLERPRSRYLINANTA
jgi:hypothetical protein